MKGIIWKGLFFEKIKIKPWCVMCESMEWRSINIKVRIFASPYLTLQYFYGKSLLHNKNDKIII